MKELKVYDESVARFGESQKSAKGLLLSWDIFSVHLQKIYGNTSDVKQLESLAKQNRWDFDLKNVRGITYDTVIVVTDPDIKIVFSTTNIAAMTGYEPSEMMGQSPKMLQGKSTSKSVARTIRKAINNQQPFEATVVNYRKDGTPYDCVITSFPIFDSKGRLSNFIAFENAA
ncbi:PAS domain-containing protein [Flavobacterium pallidum]|uniref:Histidine kinase n=1 Tax=Flavobacterium pallidum TaxID=2172098 RepID=A0A2S1SFX7_9FLAO|nr:PAS domain-containing protein [Flavobacterium pallidum]AWI25314.1 histidine kinase [Flavobacterium pallidum]